MNSQTTNSQEKNFETDDSYQSLVEELSNDLLKQELEVSKASNLNGLEARILKAASETPQVLKNSHDEYKPSWWVSVKNRFFSNSPMTIYPIVAASMLIAAVMIVGSPLPTDNGVAEEVITFSSVEVVDSEQDLESTFQELWFVEDEILFAADI